ncbi:MAG: HAD family hydrolase [Acidobacteria bacterium]|nr:HAD family hydrolase [Acidobacteriota bacterium]
MSSLVDVVDLVIFDFDGTICNSANVKTDAFYDLYLEEQGPEFATRVREYHLHHAGVSRFTKIEYIEEHMLGHPCTEERLHEVADRFGAIVTDRVVSAQLIPGVADFFGRYVGTVPMVVASAAPTEELRFIVAARGIGSWFDEVQGSPTSKPEIIASYLKSRKVTGERTVIVGDQFSDLEAASANTVMFVGYRLPDEERMFSDGTTVVRHFKDVEDAVVAVAVGAS